MPFEPHEVVEAARPQQTDESRFATDDEFAAAYAIEKPRWADLAERLK